MAADAQRRLATIVAIDAAGYSRQSEIDEAVAIQEVSSLRVRVTASAAAHGGRIFNSAGDGFMLEFPSVSGALACADELLASSRVPLRFGMHVGEVAETPEGDLLGRGVNVAARLQALADTGGLLASGDARRALTGPNVNRLLARGSLKLDKMDERVEIYALSSPWRRKSSLSLPKHWPVIAGAVLAVAAFVALVAGLPLLQARPERVAVLGFDTLGDASLGPFANSLADRVVGVMSVSDLLSIPRAQAADFRGPTQTAAARHAGAAFIVDGIIRKEDRNLRVDVHVVDSAADVTVWSTDYLRARAESSFMQEQIAANVAEVLRCALVSRRPHAGSIDPQTLAIFLRACNRVEWFDEGMDEMSEAVRQVTERAPNFARGWSMLAMADAYSSLDAPPSQAAALRAQASAAAAKARALDAENGESYLSEVVTLPGLGHWAERQALISRALALEPNSPDANSFQGDLLFSTGRISEALAAHRRAVALDPLSPGESAALLPALNATGHFAEGRELAERLYQIWPNSPSAWFNRFMGSVFVGTPQQALAILNDTESAPGQANGPARISREFAMERTAQAAWRRYLEARRQGDAGALRAAAKSIDALARAGQFGVSPAIAAIATAGDLDAAFALATVYFQSPAAEAGVLFVAPAESMRRDPRFMRLAKQAGLIDYWRQTGHWPDFCAEPDLPYDCRTEAARQH